MKQVEAAGGQRLPRIAGVADGLPIAAGADVPRPATVIWATGYRPGLDWITRIQTGGKLGVMPSLLWKSGAATRRGLSVFVPQSFDSRHGVGHRQKQGVLVVSEPGETKMLVEGRDRFAPSVDDDGGATDLERDLHRSEEGILKQRRAQSETAELQVDGKTADERRRDRVRQPRSEVAAQFTRESER